MNLNAKYDVFVSYSRKDYADESGKPIEGSAVSKLLDFLDKNEVTIHLENADGHAKVYLEPELKVDYNQGIK